jgi:alpha-aminoadipic semialdehyde synthase
MSHNYKSLASAKLALQALGNSISDEGTPKEFGPMTFVFTGSGNVSQGAQHVFKSLPHEYVDPKDIPRIATSKSKCSSELNTRMAIFSRSSRS